MGTAPTPILVSATGTGNSADGKVTRDSIDDLFGAMSSHLLIYLRASKVQVVSNFVDSLGNPVTGLTSGVTRNASDSNFNNKPSITFNNNNNVYTLNAGGIGIGAAPQPMTNSFSIIAGIRPSNANSQCLYGDNAGTSGSSNVTGFYLSTSGSLRYAVGSSSYTDTGVVILSPATTGVIWVSFDAAASALRAGLNNATPLVNVSTANTRTGAGTGTACIPFGLSGGGGAGNQSWNRWALFNKAYLNGSAPSDDAAFANLLSSYAANI